MVIKNAGDGAVHNPASAATRTPGASSPAPTDEELLGQAITEVMTGIQPLERGDRNKFANYNYASIDSFLDMLRPLLAKAGLSILMSERSFDVRDVQSVGERDNVQKTRSMLFVTYDFHLAHKSGVTSGMFTRTVSVPAGGAQAWGSAQSYALKQFCRSMFMISTGERDSDADAHEPVVFQPTPTIDAMKSSLIASVFLEDIKGITDKMELQKRYTTLKGEGGQIMTRDDKQTCMTEYVNRLAALSDQELKKDK